MSRITLSAIFGLAIIFSMSSVADAGWRHHGYGHGYYANRAPAAHMEGYYGQGYWYRTPYWYNGVLSDYYGGYRPGYSHGLYHQQGQGAPYRGNVSVPYDYAPRATQAPTSIPSSPTSFNSN